MALPIAQGPGAAPAALTPETRAQLDRIVQSHDLVLFMKGTPEAPQCGFSARAAQVYQATGRPFHTVNVFDQPDPMAYITQLAEWAEWPTLPQCWVKGELIGGSDIALEMYQKGELEEMLQGA